MRKGYVWMCVLLALSARGEMKQVRGRVTYVAAGTVYTSLGRNAGIQDSTLLFIVTGRDTTATLKVFAVSSKSSACWVLRGVRPVVAGEEVSGVVEVTEARPATADTLLQQRESSTPLPNPRALPPVPVQEEFLSVKGRLSAQYFTSLYDNALFNISQPGIVVNLRGAFRDAPVKFDVYANFRTLALGNRSPFASGAINQTRIYGLSISYDDGANTFSAGRIIPMFSPSIGYVDGIMASRAFGNVTVGGTAGYQPAFNLRSLSTEYRKFALFVQYAAPNRAALSVSMAYARTYFHSALDREATSVLLNASLAPNLFLYANSEVDLRRKSGTDFILSPRLTSAYVNLHYRIIREIGVGIGADASRPYYSFEAVRLIPDSLMRSELRSGVSLSVNCLLPGGISLYNMYTPRNSTAGRFGTEYANTSSVTFADIFSSGVNLRSSVNLNANQYTKGSGYGASVQRTFGQLLDVNVRFQRSSYRVRQTGGANTSTTIGGDVMVFLTNALNLLFTYDRLNGFGTVTNSVFAELSVKL